MWQTPSRRYSRRTGGGAIDAIALGCTHYTFLLPEFEALYPEIAWFDPALPVARQTFAVTQGFEDGRGEKMRRISRRGCRILRRCGSGWRAFGFEEVAAF